MKKKMIAIGDALLFPTKQQKIVMSMLVLVMVILVYFFVYYTGGIKYVYSHTMYIPILLMSIILGFKGGIVVALIGTLLLGPFMPIDIQTGEEQLLMNWLYRGLIFLLIATVSGLSVDILRMNRKRNIELLSKHQYTNIKMFNAVPKEERLMRVSKSAFVLRVLNYQHIVDYLGIEKYFKHIENIYKQINESDILEGFFYHIDNRTFALISEPNHIEEKKKTLVELVKQDYVLDQIPVYYDFVIGVDDDYDTLNNLVENAMIAARQAELNFEIISTYESKFRKNQKAFTLVSELNRAINQEELFLTYQPIVSNTTHKVVGLEALIRWQHPKFGLLYPGSFIPFVEQTQLINNLTLFIAHKVKNEILPIIKDKDIYVSINMSPKNIRNAELIQTFKKDNMFTQEEREHIVFEITESVLMNSTDAVLDVLWNIKNSGFRLALDDFGTGYSSLSYLGKYPLDIVKIDKSFIQRYSDKATRNIVETTIDLSHSLGYQVVAEGLETQYMVNQFAETDCDYIQGFYISYPVNIDKIKEFLLYQEEPNHVQ